MTTTTFTHPQQHLAVCRANSWIDTAPFAVRYAVLTQAVLTFLAAGQFGRMLRCSQTVLRLVRAMTKIEAQNILLRRKRAMLGHAPWRDRVLSDLGGTRKLEAWEAAHHRNASRIETKSAKDCDVTQPWLYTPERIAESERLKAHARKSMRASVNPRLFRDRVKMDFDGLFRLAPVPRGVGRARRTHIYTQNSIVDYRWNPVPFAKVEGFGPASVWPAEFYKAMGARSDHNRASHDHTNDTIIMERRSRKTSDIKKDGPRITETEAAIIPLRDALPRKTYRAIFETPI